ncbi:MAG: HAMP domain-containing sensor histidine kinase [Polyangia bacterium]|jgi:K+-sensing histidine kinase KdpD
MTNDRSVTLRKIVEGASHDLRTPLSVIMVNAAVLASPEPMAEERRIKAASRIVASVGRMNRMVGDLFDFALAEMGIPVPYRMLDADLGELALKAVKDARAAFPGRIIVLEHTGELRGHWDQDRVLRSLQTMLTSALRLGNSSEPVRLVCCATPAQAAVDITVEAAINPAFGDHVQRLFDTIRSHGEFEKDPHWIPLVVLQETVTAHHGSLRISASPSEGIRMSVSLPVSQASQLAQGSEVVAVAEPQDGRDQ